MKPIHFRLSVFEPDEVFKPLISFDAKQAFLGIDRQDLINPGLWPKLSGRRDLCDKLLRVVGVEHGIEEFDNHILHVVDVFTVVVENTESARHQGFFERVVGET